MSFWPLLLACEEKVGMRSSGKLEPVAAAAPRGSARGLPPKGNVRVLSCSRCIRARRPTRRLMMAKGKEKLPTRRLNGAGAKDSTATRGWGMAGGRSGHDLGALVAAIRQIHDHCAAQAGKAINISLTLRNWAIGYYIHAYEQEGSDRASYGERLLDVLSARLRRVGVAEIAPRTLRQSRLFFQTYPRIWRTLSAKSGPRLLPPKIWQKLSARSKSARAAVGPPRSRDIVSFPPERLVNSLSFSHLVELCSVVDPVQRAFYEAECMRGNWSVREGLRVFRCATRG
jgi:hypothetical protein